ncbi:hypothetical protein ASE92_17305 [Pedobacter sp. Leaf41]|uniref:ATP-dependent nuclease n=1 Tax=Pedobacter sp. Leaf41 TaxID=1736218 RepID=UPI0007027F83|nr:AAA family ATPase [Pedobacter sp. Leaf41]KQN32363.1 hypothetical protein ASE92_17305 [Pedobacter sp. Leaf41]
MIGSISLKEITFKNGYKLILEENSIVLFVGANNSGKSVTLKELYTALLKNNTLKNVAIASIATKTSGSVEDFKENIEHRLINGSYFSKAQSPFQDDGLKRAWDNNDSGILSQFNVNILHTSDRLNLVSPPSSIDLLSQPPVHPFHTLQMNGDLLADFTRYFKTAFDIDITLNFGAGGNVPMHVGKKPIIKEGDDRVSSSYLKNLKELPQLQVQGDGMKSFAGVFLSLIAENYGINLIDEPEAFLHPPQAKLLGQMISKNVHENKQILIATHSEHFLKGILDYAGDRLTIIRLKRENNVVEYSTLNNNDLKIIWKDSILRHSNVLDGLFHSKVVLCESDSDCRLLSALATAIVEHEVMPSPDIHYIQAGGKARFPTVMNALKQIDVPLTIIADFDLYNNEQPLKEMYEIMGGNWADIQKEFKIVKQDIDNQRPELNTVDAKKALENVFDEASEPNLSDKQIKELQQILKKSSAWTKAKSAGKAILTAGDATVAFKKLNLHLEKVGIIIIQIGEIESFDKSVGNHGPKWVNSVLEKDLILSPDLEEIRCFVKTYILNI